MTIAAGATFSLDGDYTQTASGELDIAIAGVSHYGRLFVAGGHGAVLGGSLDVRFVGAYVPIDGQTFTFATYGSETGAFATHFPVGFTGNVDYDATAAVLTINGAPTPTLSASRSARPTRPSPPAPTSSSPRPAPTPTRAPPT